MVFACEIVFWIRVRAVTRMLLKRDRMKTRGLGECSQVFVP
jgi:hypothetical protein